MEHKKKLAEDRAKRVLEERKKAALSQPAPTLGRGFGDVINLSSSPRLDAKKAKALALLQSKGKSLEKAEPNHVPHRKRKLEEQNSSKKKVAKVLEEKSQSNENCGKRQGN